MQYFALLTAATAVIAVLALALYRKRRDPGILIGTGALYYWSLFGAWYIVIDKSGGFSGKHYQYLELKLFPIALDNDYLLALALYSGFVIVTLVTLAAALSSKRERPIPRLVLHHEPILIPGFLAGLGSWFIIHDKISAAWALHTSAYWYTRSQTDQWFTLHQVLNRVALIPPAVGFATLLAGGRSKYFVSVRKPHTMALYLALLAGMAVFTFVLGNKNEVLVALVTGVLCYVNSVRRPNLLKVGLALAAGFWFLYSIDFFRAVPVADLERAVEGRLDETTAVAEFLTSSNEAYGAHFSMYGVLAERIPPRFGYSFYSLACSVIPRVLWPDRPRDIYLYYSEQVGAIQNQGYSLHHATGWYLNFGMAGVALGGLVLGLVWAYGLNAHQRIRPQSGLMFRLFATIAPWVFVANLPPLIRAGPEGYKGFVLEAVLIPVGVLALACRPKKAAPGAFAVFYASKTLRFDHHPVPQ